MAARWVAFVVWAAVAASATAWALRLFVPARGAPLHTSTVDTAQSARGDLTRLFGVTVAPAPVVAPVVVDNRFKLVGVAAPRPTGPAGAGYALIAVDGKPARAFRVGAVVDGETVLKEVRPRGASLGPRAGPAVIALEIPPLPAAATGTSPAAPIGGNVLPVQPSQPQDIPQRLPTMPGNPPTPDAPPQLQMQPQS